MPHAGASAAIARRPRDDADGQYPKEDGLRLVGGRPETSATRRTAAPTTAAPGPGAPLRGGVPGRRTITIQGRGAERYTPARPRRNRPRAPHERAGFRPDRAALWAVLLGVLLILAAATSSHAATLAAQGAAAHAHVLGFH
jgi:hypothetical protein